MTSLYLSWIDTLEASLKTANEVTDQAHGNGLRSGLAMNDLFFAGLRLWFPWTF